MEALVLSYFYKTLKWKNFKESVFLTAKTTAMIMWLFIGSWTFASVFSYLGGHEVFEHFFKSLDLQPWQFLVITQIIIFLLGWPLEWTEILIIFVPIFLPLVEFFGVNPYFFAMLIALNLQTSFLTPFNVSVQRSRSKIVFLYSIWIRMMSKEGSLGEKGETSELLRQLLELKL